MGHCPRTSRTKHHPHHHHRPGHRSQTTCQKGRNTHPIPTTCEGFQWRWSPTLPPSQPWDHAIELKANAPESLNCKVYPLSQTERTTLREFLDEQLEKGYIRPSKSQYASPFFFIKKKDGKLHPVQDYRELNKYTIPNCYVTVGTFTRHGLQSITWPQH